MSVTEGMDQPGAREIIPRTRKTTHQITVTSQAPERYLKAIHISHFPILRPSYLSSPLAKVKKDGKVELTQSEQYISHEAAKQTRNKRGREGRKRQRRQISQKGFKSQPTPAWSFPPCPPTTSNRAISKRGRKEVSTKRLC